MCTGRRWYDGDGTMAMVDDMMVMVDDAIVDDTMAMVDDATP